MIKTICTTKDELCATHTNERGVTETSTKNTIFMIESFVEFVTSGL